MYIFFAPFEQKYLEWVWAILLEIRQKKKTGMNLNLLLKRFLQQYHKVLQKTARKAYAPR